MRRLHVDRIRTASRLHTTDDLSPYDPGTPFRDTAVEGFENATAARAFASLPEGWQTVLWHTEVEGQKPADVGLLLGMSANSVSALAYRAREGLRQAFLSMHVREAQDDAPEARAPGDPREPARTQVDLRITVTSRPTTGEVSVRARTGGLDAGTTPTVTLPPDRSSPAP